MRYFVFAISNVLILFVTAPQARTQEIQFRKHLLNSESEFSAATVLDVNRDGRSDIVSGAWWYENPSWIRHTFRDVPQIRGRFDDYSNLPLDVDADGNMDIVSVNYRSQSLYWCRNPGLSQTTSRSDAALWKQILIDQPGSSETGRLADINGDGQLDVLPNGTTFAAWYEITRQNDGHQFEWVRHALPDELAGHGIGHGDINADGRTDIFGPNGWAEAPLDPQGGRWIWHPEFKLARDCGLPILCYDVDQDGDSDLVWGRGHNVGLYWTEQIDSDKTSLSFEPAIAPSIVQQIRPQITTNKWVTHAIDTRFSCLHTLMLADIDGDGTEDLVTGRRFMGHDGKDPGENDPLAMAWYRFDRNSKCWQDHLITVGGTCGVDLDSICADIDRDGDVDILCPARSGLHWLENLRIADSLDKAETIRTVGPEYLEHQDLRYFVDGTGKKSLIENPLHHGIRRQHTLLQMQQVMGRLPGAQSRPSLDVSVASVSDASNYWRIKLTYRAEQGDRVPAFLLVPKGISEPVSAMLCLHPTNFELGKAQICGLGGKPSRFYAHELAERGFVCLAPDYPGFAEYPYDFEQEQYESGSMKAVWNNIRGLDLLESLPCVARDRIGAIGHSLGGHNALFTAAFDQRIRCVVTSCGFTAFDDYYSGDLKGWSSDRYMPRIANVFEFDPRKMPFDFPEVLAAVAPRPLFVNAPIRDSNFEVTGVRKCAAAVQPLYQVLGSPKNVEFHYPDAEHDFPQSIRMQAYQWLEKQLD